MKVTADDDNRLPPGRTPRVLVGDDEESLRELLELTLVGMGLDVDVAEDLSTARAMLERYRYSLCLTDMRLPDGNGLDVCAAYEAHVHQLIAEAAHPAEAPHPAEVPHLAEGSRSTETARPAQGTAPHHG